MSLREKIIYNRALLLLAAFSYKGSLPIIHEFSVTDRGCHVFAKHIPCNTDGDDHSSLIELGLLNNSLEIMNIYVGPPHKGLGSKFAEDIKLLASDLGLGKISAYAVSNAHLCGAYFWAKHGYYPSPQRWRFIKPEIISRLGRLVGQLPVEGFLEAFDVLKSDDPKSIEDVASLPYRVWINDNNLTLGQALLGPNMGSRIEYSANYRIRT